MSFSHVTSHVVLDLCNIKIFRMAIYYIENKISCVIHVVRNIFY